MRNTVLFGDCLELLKTLPDNSVHCCVTSPPYLGLRDYGVEGQIGLEKTPDEYVGNIVGVFREVRRVLHPSGTAWVNIGDCYATTPTGNMGTKSQLHGAYTSDKYTQTIEEQYTKHSRPSIPTGMKPKDLMGIPWMVAFALRADGWWLRSDIIWHKPMCMPESIKDRPTVDFEHIFLFAKSEHYFYDAASIREPSKTTWNSNKGFSPDGQKQRQSVGTAQNGGVGPRKDEWQDGRNKRTVWSINPKPYKGAHFATFPPELPETCIKAGTSERGCCPTCSASWVRDGDGWKPDCKCQEHEPIPCLVLDPFTGSGTTLAIAKWLGRDYVGIELNPEYGELIEDRLRPAEEHQSELDTYAYMMKLGEENFQD